MSHADFSGTIPEDEYGGGEVRIFDRGSYEMVDRNEERITFRLDGERLQGKWHLVYTGPERGRDQWLAIMSEDLRPAGDPPPPADPMGEPGTQPGAEKVLKVAGLPRLNGSRRGSQRVILEVFVPTNLSEEQRENARALAERFQADLLDKQASNGTGRDE